MHKLFLLSVLLISFSIRSQRSNTWFFGTNAGLSFNTNQPTTLSGGQTNGPDNTSTISDANGNLLFYTNGVSVWRSNHALMPNGSGLIGHISAGQCALIMPIPCDASKYVIFHTTEFASPGQLHYTVVDMSLNGGLGDVVAAQKNVSLGTGWTEKLCAYYNPAIGAYWLLTHKWNSDAFVAFKVTSTSIATQSVVTAIGSVHNCGTYSAAHDAMGQLTISPDGKKVLNALTCQDKFELFKFDAATGILSTKIDLPVTGGSAWGTAFSPDNTKIYTNSIFGSTIYQYNISNYNQISIEATQYAVVTTGTSGYNFGYMELGPDNKLYVAKPGASALSVINSPNGLGSACNFSLAGQSLGSAVSTHGLSRIAYNIPSTQSAPLITVSAAPSLSLCAGQTLTLTASGGYNYSWNNGIALPTITVTPGATTSYTVSASNTCGASQAVVNATVNPLPVISVAKPAQFVCRGLPVTFTASGAASYLWSTGQTTSIITDTPQYSTTYTVTGTSNQGCQTTYLYPYIVTICEGIADHSSQNTVKTYPNPVHDVLTFELPAADFKTIEILNSRGETLYSYNRRELATANGAFQLQVGDLVKGIYVLRIKSDRQVLTNKFVKD